MDFDVDLPDLTCPDLFLISVERVTYSLSCAVWLAIDSPLKGYSATRLVSLSNDCKKKIHHSLADEALNSPDFFAGLKELIPINSVYGIREIHFVSYWFHPIYDCYVVWGHSSDT